MSLSNHSSVVLAGGEAALPRVAAQTMNTTAAYTLALPLICRYYDGHVMLYGVKVDGSPLSTAVTRAKEARIKWTRQAISWGNIEPTNVSPAQYDWSAYDNTLLTLAQAGVRSIVTVGGNPSWAAATQCGPISSTHLADYAEFVGALVSRYGQPPYNVKYWEFYNEPDNTDPVNYGWLGGCWGGHGAEYATMLKTVYPVIKAADPNAQVAMGGLAYDNFTDWPVNPGPFERDFLDSVIDPARGNAADYFDVMNFHFYVNFAQIWETERPGEKGIVAKTNYLRAKLAEYGVSKPFICTETGMWSDPANGGSDELQGRYVAQAFARGMAADLDVIIWFTLTDYQTEWLYGLLKADLSRKPAYSAYQTLTSELPNVRFRRRLTVLDTGNENIEGYEFEDRETGKTTGVLWTNDGGSYQMAFPGNAIRWVEKIAYHADGTPNSGAVHIVYDGSADDLDTVAGQVTIWITPSPIYVSAYP